MVPLMPCIQKLSGLGQLTAALKDTGSGNTERDFKHGPHFRKKKRCARSFRGAQSDGKTVHFAFLMDLCHFMDAELATHLQKISGASRVSENVTFLWTEAKGVNLSNV